MLTTVKWSFAQGGRFWFARVVALVLLAGGFATLAAVDWPNDARVAPGTDIENLWIQLAPAGAQVSQIIYRPASDGGTLVSVEVQGASKEFNVLVDLATSTLPGAEGFGPCSHAQLPRFLYGDFANCSKDSISVDGAKEKSQGKIKDPSGMYYKAVFEIPPRNPYGGYPGKVSVRHGYAAVSVPPVQVTIAGQKELWYFSWTTYMALPSDMASVDWTEGATPTRMSFATPWSLDDSTGQRAHVGQPPGPSTLYAEWLLKDSDQGLIGQLSFPGVTASGEVVSQLDSDEIDLFLSGASVGVAGAALIALATELIRSWPVKHNERYLELKRRRRLVSITDPIRRPSM